MIWTYFAKFANIYVYVRGLFPGHSRTLAKIPGLFQDGLPFPGHSRTVSTLLNGPFIPKKVEGDRDRRPFWAGGENQVARSVLEVFWEKLVHFFHRMGLRT